jgi:hypothetical protein
MPVSSIGQYPSAGNGRYSLDGANAGPGGPFARHNTQVSSFSFCSWKRTLEVWVPQRLPAHYARFFRALGHRIRSYRAERQLSQEDMISYGFGVR